MNKRLMLALVAVAALAAAKAARADTILAYSQVVNTGLSTSYNTNNILTTTTYNVANDGRVFLHFKKSGAGTATVSIVTAATVQGLAVADLSISIPASTGDKIIGPFAPSLFNDSNGNVGFTVSGDTTSLSMAAFRL